MGDGALDPLTRAVDARKRGEQPKPADLAECKRVAFKGDMRCWNGKRSDRPECGFASSQNIPFYAWAGLGQWDKIRDACILEAQEGNCGRENCCPSVFYYEGPLGIKVDAQGSLLKLGDAAGAEAVRLAIRSNLAWDCITALAVPRLRDEANFAGQVVRVNAKRARRRLTVAVAGMRCETHGRGELTSQDAHSEALAGELASVDALGLTREEIRVMQAAIAGDVESAREVSSWMFGTIDTPDTQWSWRLRRTTLGAESYNRSPWPSPYKPCTAVVQVTYDGTWRSMRPVPQAQTNNWAKDYATDLVDGMIHAACIAGEAEIPELGGDLLWQVEAVGSGVTFTT